MNNFLKFLIKLSNFSRFISLITLKILKLFKKNRGYFNIGNNIMFLDFLDPIDRKIIISQKYEQNEISTLKELSKNFDVVYFFDIGANNGYYSIKFAEFHENIKIIAFEPNDEAYFKFKKNLDANQNFSKRITLHNFGLSDKNSTERMRSKVKYGYTQTGGSTIHDGKKYDDVKIHDANFKIADELLDIKNSNLILKVIDASYFNIDMHITTIENTLEEIKCLDIPSLYIFNKIDLINNDRLLTLMKRYKKSIFVSGLKNIGLDHITNYIAEEVAQDYISEKIKLTYSDLGLIDDIYKTFNIISRKDLEDGVLLVAEGKKESFNKIRSKLKKT